jgi:hypothetical protein
MKRRTTKKDVHDRGPEYDPACAPDLDSFYRPLVTAAAAEADRAAKAFDDAYAKRNVESAKTQLRILQRATGRLMFFATKMDPGVGFKARPIVDFALAWSEAEKVRGQQFVDLFTWRGPLYGWEI